MQQQLWDECGAARSYCSIFVLFGLANTCQWQPKSITKAVRGLHAGGGWAALPVHLRQAHTHYQHPGPSVGTWAARFNTYTWQLD